MAEGAFEDVEPCPLGAYTPQNMGAVAERLLSTMNSSNPRSTMFTWLILSITFGLP